MSTKKHGLSQGNRLFRSYIYNLKLFKNDLIENPEGAVLLCVTISVIWVILLNIKSAMWFDESWRAQAISTMRMWRNDGEAPIPLLVMLLTKLFTLFYNVEFTQRIVTYIAGLATIPIVYKLGKAIKDKWLGTVLVSGVSLSLLFTEYIIQNKPYILDALGAILFILIFELFINKGIKLWQFIAFCIVYLCASLPAFMLFAASGIYSFWLIAQKKTRLVTMASWAVPIFIVYLCYYLLFLRPQVTPGLIAYWEPMGGQGISGHAKLIAKHLFTLFGFPSAWWPSITINDLLINVTVFTRAAIFIAVANVTLFAIGAWTLVKTKKSFLLIAIGSSLVLSYVAMLAGYWAFGNNRTNFFLVILIMLVSLVGFHKLLSLAWQFRRPYNYLIVGMLLVLITVSLPYKTYAKRYLQTRPALYLQGMRDGVYIIKTKGGLDDQIVNVHFMNKPSFMYYYYDYSPNKFGTTLPEQNITFDDQQNAIVTDVQFYRQLSNKHGLARIWMICGAGLGYDCLQNSSATYDTIYSTDIDYIKLGELRTRNIE